MGNGFSIKISARDLHRAMDRIGREIGVISEASLDEIMEKAKSYAEDKYKEAEYDGVSTASAITVTVEKSGKTSRTLKAEGDIVKFVEWGTGVKSVAHGSKGKKYWYFSGKGRDIHLSSTGKRYEYRYVRRREKKENTYRWRVRGMVNKDTGEDVYVSENLQRFIQRDKHGYFLYHRKNGRIPLSKVEVEGGYTGEKETVKVERKNPVYMSEGNLPAGVMSKTREYIYGIAPKIVNKNLRKLK